MNIVKCSLCCLLFLSVGVNVYADENRCDKYKITPGINIENPVWNKNIIQEKIENDSLHGVTEAILKSKFSAEIQGIFVKDGFCVVLNSVNYSIGFDEIVVKIDNRYQPDSCEYNAVLNHEDKHVNVCVSVLNKHYENVKTAVQNAANLVKPVFVKKQSDFDSVLQQFVDEIKNNPDFIAVIKNINDEIDSQNKDIDENEDGHEIKKCINENW